MSQSGRMGTPNLRGQKTAVQGSTRRKRAVKLTQIGGRPVGQAHQGHDPFWEWKPVQYLLHILKYVVGLGKPAAARWSRISLSFRIRGRPAKKETANRQVNINR